MLRLPARALFEGTRGATLALNLGAPLAKEFTPAEIAGLLGAPGPDGDAGTAKGDAIGLSVPLDEPVAFIAAVTTVFARHPEVRAAYLGRLIVEGSQAPARLIVGVVGEGDLAEALQDASAAWDPGADPEGLADFVHIHPDENELATWLIDKGMAFYQASA